MIHHYSERICERTTTDKRQRQAEDAQWLNIMINLSLCFPFIAIFIYLLVEKCYQSFSFPFSLLPSSLFCWWTSISVTIFFFIFVLSSLSSVTYKKIVNILLYIFLIMTIFIYLLVSLYNQFSFIFPLSSSSSSINQSFINNRLYLFLSLLQTNIINQYLLLPFLFKPYFFLHSFKPLLFLDFLLFYFPPSFPVIFR